MTPNERAYCWGYNSAGQLGDGTLTDRSSPVQVFGSRLRFTQIAAGREFTCALSRSASVYCWGENDYGQMGNGTTVDQLIPGRVRFP